ncbi:hypothetical protein GCM10007853_18150 [Algimonas ampicilliniresistens]|jgi:uncharacterized repeat protein (TIGR03806 family)|uniref:Cytochrome c domain-containing protein n=1 Tax=Algimonas ampicilliniresistens TaxID=1298735 RepID=A0ABQ5V8R7_9PROT|nr:hypothetical protein [Algimonas ampicilliniresistens]GLQ23941.1 hypothetical protein GCM10007853_18150 [Algimonas ampicilliniresistens]
MKRLALIAAIGAFRLAACSQAPDKIIFHEVSNPLTLAEWNVVSLDRGHLVTSGGSVAYDVSAPLFTDYAHKFRTVYTPDAAPILADGSLDFPVGTVISKTFYYPENADGVVRSEDSGGDAINLATHRVIETRLLVRRDSGWDPVSYVWNEGETEARLKRTGAVVPLTLSGMPFAYVVPNENQCAGCHASDMSTKALHPLGAIAPQFRDRSKMVVEGVMRPDAFTAQADYRDDELSLDVRARSYLATNCAHCHNPVGPADTSGLDLSLSAQSDLVLGRCKPPIAAGSGTGGHTFSIVPGDPDGSILSYRMASTDPGAMMPELGRSIAHDEGVALIREWIAAMDGDCS